MKDAIKAIVPFRRLIHLGDGAADGQSVAEEYKIPCTAVYGNDDYGSRLNETELLRINGWSIFILHGHQLEMNPYESESARDANLSRLSQMAKQHNAQVLFFGHTHQPLMTKTDDILICNPGDQFSGSAFPASFALLEIDNNQLSVTIMQQQHGAWQSLTTDSLFRQ